MKSAGSLTRGKRRRDEIPDVPVESDLSELERTAQRVLIDMVEKAGGRFDSGRPIPVAHLDVLTDLLADFGRRHADERDGRLVFSGRPGMWHALDDLCPLQDPNRWDKLRASLAVQLERRGWRRISPPRGSSFVIPTGGAYSGITGSIRRSADWLRRALPV